MLNQITIITFYKFVSLPKFKEMYSEIKNFCITHNIKGTILLGQEGINATISGLDKDIKLVLSLLISYKELSDLNYKISYYKHHPFVRLKVKIKKEIVTLGINNLDLNKTGKYIEPDLWNQFITNPNVITIDTRNKYETKIGCFKNSIIPNINSFREFPDFFKKNFNHLDKNTKIAMYCTGGIRCEKSTAYLLNFGFNNIYHLHGGILNYLYKIPSEASLWQGECFVFDNRIGLDKNLNKGEYIMCPGCRYPVAKEEQLSNNYKKGVYCPNCFDSISEKTIKRAEARNKQLVLAIKKNNSSAVFN